MTLRRGLPGVSWNCQEAPVAGAEPARQSKRRGEDEVQSFRAEVDRLKWPGVNVFGFAVLNSAL